jgi:hypothetical protein
MLDLRTETIIRQAEREALGVERRRPGSIVVSKVAEQRSGEEGHSGKLVGPMWRWLLQGGGRLLAIFGSWLGNGESTVAASLSIPRPLSPTRRERGARV